MNLTLLHLLKNDIVQHYSSVWPSASLVKK